MNKYQTTPRRVGLALVSALVAAPAAMLCSELLHNYAALAALGVEEWFLLALGFAVPKGIDLLLGLILAAVCWSFVSRRYRGWAVAIALAVIASYIGPHLLALLALLILSSEYGYALFDPLIVLGLSWDDSTRAVISGTVAAVAWWITSRQARPEAAFV